MFLGGWALVHAILLGSGSFKMPDAATPSPRARTPATRAQPATIRARQARIIRIELVSCVASVALGAAFEAGGHTLRDVSLGLFGWAAGTAAHLTLTFAGSRLRRRRSSS
ncbi:MAG: hypothetical protein ACRDLP_10855 [Solirubrobacteraceae bacterium]